MPTLTELVEREATQYESEAPDEEEDGDEAPDEEEDEAPDDEEAEPEASAIDQKALERALGRHEKAMRRILGAAFEDLAACPLCDGFGFTPEPVTGPPELQRDPDTETCPVCAGYGDVLTGAKPPREPTRACTRCAGSGYVTRTPSPGTPQLVPGVPSTASGALPAAAAAAVNAGAVEALRAAGYTVFEPVPPPVVSAS